MSNPHRVTPSPAHTNNAADTSQPSGEVTSSQPVLLSDAANEMTQISSSGSSVSATAVLQFIGDYVVVKKIGEGGMGAVYLAEDTKLRRKAAVKTMRRELAADPSNRERFLREARAAAAVEHDNIVPIWQIGETSDGSPFIAMPFLQGEPLDVRLKRQALPGLGLVVKVAREVADALAAAHARGLIHRDIKPANVWLEGDPTATDPAQQVRRCKVLDFGLARSTEQDDGHLTASGAILGTPAYMAPEQARGEKADHRADLWSLGVMLYRIATGEMPFKGSNTMAILTELATKTPSSSGVLNPNLPPEVAALIDQLMCKDPAGRPKSAAEVAATVRQIVKNLQAKRGSANPAASAISAPRPATGVAVGSLDLDDIAKSAAPSQPAAPAPVPPVPPPASTSVPPPASRAWEEVTEAEAVAKPKTPPSARPKAPAKMPEKAPAKAMEPEEPEAKSPKRKPAPKVTAKSAGKRSRMPLFIAGGVFALIALVVAAVVILRVETPEGTLVVEITDPNVEARIKDGKLVLVGPDGKDRYTITPGERNKKIDAGSYTIRVEGADGLALDTREFSLKKGGQVIVRVTLDPKVVAKKPDVPRKDEPKASLNPDRTAAEYVLSIGGTVRVNDQNQEIKAVAELPKDAFRLTSVNLQSNKQVNDAGLANFKDCKNLTILDLNGTQASDAGLAHFKDCKNLTYLSLANIQVGDAGVAHFKDCKNLMTLSLNNTQVDDAGLAHFKDCKDLIQLDLPGTRMSDAGLAHFKDCKNLTVLNLFSTRVGDVGLAHFKDCKNLRTINLGSTQVSDAGLSHLKDSKDLTGLHLQKTKVTAKGIEELKKTIPGCKIAWDGSEIEPTKK